MKDAEGRLRFYGISAAALFVILLLVGAASAIAGGNKPVPAPTSTTAETAIVQPIPSPAPACSNARNEITTTQDLIRRGKFALAADMANETLSTHDALCPEAKLTLATLAHSATVSDILATPSTDFGQRDLLRWQEAERRAIAAGVPNNQRFGPLALMTQASNTGKWRLARGAFVKAWDDGLVDHQDLSAAETYYSLMRTLGANLVESGTPDNRLQGLITLRTSMELSSTWRLKRGEAEADLRKYLGPDVKTWPPPAGDDPVLMAKRLQ